MRKDFELAMLRPHQSSNFFTILSRASALASDRTNRDRSSAKARWLKFVAVYGGEHPLVADTQVNMGVVYDKQGNLAEAKEVFSEAYKIRSEKLGPDHPATQKLKPFTE